jgi:hypothetical protein
MWERRRVSNLAPEATIDHHSFIRTRSMVTNIKQTIFTNVPPYSVDRPLDGVDNSLSCAVGFLGLVYFEEISN